MTEQPAEVSARYLQINGLTLDLLNPTVDMGGRAVRLTQDQFGFLAVVARQAPKAVDFQSLVRQAQGRDNIDPFAAQELWKGHIHALRQAIELDVSEPRLIINQRGLGYAMTGQGQSADGPASMPAGQPSGPIDRWERCGLLGVLAADATVHHAGGPQGLLFRLRADAQHPAVLRGPRAIDADGARLAGGRGKAD